LRPYMAYLIQRWREGCTDSMQLWRETRALGACPKKSQYTGRSLP